MAVYPRTGRSPEALVKILITVIERTPSGGATLDEIRAAYRDAKDTEPTDRTIYRNIRRINELFNPFAYEGTTNGGAGTGGRCPQNSGASSVSLAIRSQRDSTGTTRYLYTGRKAVSNVESNQALMIILGLYSQQRGTLKGYFEKVISSLLQEVISRKRSEDVFFSEADRHIFVSGHGSADPTLVLRRITEIIRAIDNCKAVKFEYSRTYDGAVYRREVEPYGLVCRHGNWYLVGLCRTQQQRRIYFLDQVRCLEVNENSTFTRPAGFSIRKVFGSSWGIWNPDDNGKMRVETVRLKVVRGVAERFKAVLYHDSQKVTCLNEGGAEVTFEVSGADEMIPWLMSWGATVEVEEPQWLREKLRASLQKAINCYTP